MAAVKAPQAVVEAPAAFVAPVVEIGQIVLWASGPGEVPCPAVVQKVGGGGSLSLTLHIEGVKDHVFRNGAGIWRLTERDRRINVLLTTHESTWGDEG